MSKPGAKASQLRQALEVQEALPDPRIRRKFRTSLTVKNKLEVIEYANQNPNATQSKIASHFGIDRTTVSKVLKKRGDILAYADKFNEGSDLAMTSTLMKKDSPSPEISDSGFRDAKVNTTAKTRQRPVLPKKAVQLDERLTLSQDQSNVYHPELLTKCESWFMDQKLSKGTEHVTNIRAFSKLISIIPLSDALCYKILAGKVVRDACLTWIKDTLLKSPQDLGKNLSSRSFELLHRFILEEFANVDLEPYFCDGFKAFEADDVKRIWVKYIQPKLGLLTTVTNTIDTQVLQTNGKTVWTVQAGDGNMSHIATAKDMSTYPAADLSDDLSQPDSPGWSPKGNDTVKGSRKRKMNSRPVRMVNVDVEGDVEASNGSDPLKSLLLNQLDNQMQPHSNKVRKMEDITLKNTQYAFNGKSHNVIPPVGVIEIKPDDCSDEENEGGVSAPPSFESPILSQKHPTNLLQEGKKAGDKAHYVIGKTVTQSSGNVNTSSVINRICTEHARKVIEGISANISQVVKTAAAEQPKCDCDCAGLKARVEAMEKTLQTLQDTLNKVYQATCSDHTKDNNNVSTE